MTQNKLLVVSAKCACAALITASSLFPIVAIGGIASCGWEAVTVQNVKPFNCKLGSYSDCFIEGAYSDSARKVPVSIYTRSTDDMTKWVDSTSDCQIRYTKVTGYLCKWGMFFNSCTSTADPLGSLYSTEESRCKLVTKSDCQNNISFSK